MKHIGFDDSTVLREYAKIAAEKGFVKEAAANPITDALKRINDARPVLLQKYDKDPNRNAKVQQMLANMVKQEVAKLKKQFGNHPAIAEFERQGMELAKVASNENEFAKSAEEPKRDVDVFVEELGKLTQTGVAGFTWDDIQKSLITDVVITAQKLREKNLPLQQVAAETINFIKKSKKSQFFDKYFALPIESGTDRLVGLVMEAYKTAQEYAFAPTVKEKVRPILYDVLQTVKNPVLKEKLKDLNPNITAEQLKEYLKTIGFTAIPAELVPILGKTSSLSVDMSKLAEGKLYDISGETGEQLVEKAHPGGGTKTELTHSKTDENLVETIVEQQEKDIDVAHSVPKGTYALLINLYNQLHKMGYEKHLGGLANTINKIATDEDMVMYTLSVLADNLDAHGFIDVADRVDEIAKLAGIFDWWVNYDLIGKVIDRLEDIDKSDEPPLSTWLQRLQNLKMQYNNVLGQVGSTPEEQAKIDQSKSQIANVVKTNLEQLQKVYTTMKGQGQIEEWSGDDTEFETQLQQVIDLLSKEQQKIDVKIDPNWEQSEEVKQWGEEFQQQQEEEGMAGKGKPATKEDSELKKWQANYNMLLKKVKSKGIDISQYSGGKKGNILVDGIPGPETAQAKKDAPKLKALLEGKSTAEKPAGKTFTDAEVMKRMYDSAISQLEDKFGYTGLSEEPTETKRISDIIRQHSSFYNLSDKKGRQNAWNVIKKEIGKLYPARA